MFYIYIEGPKGRKSIYRLYKWRLFRLTNHLKGNAILQQQVSLTHRTQMTWSVKGLGSTQVALHVYVERFNMIWVGSVLFRASKNKLRFRTWSSKHQNQQLVDDLLITPLFWVHDPRMISKALHFLCSTYVLQAEKKARLIIFLINVIYLAPCRFSCLVRLYELQEIGMLV